MRHPQIDVEEMTADGLLRAVEIADGWKPEIGQPFDDYIYTRVQWHMLDCLRRRRWSGRRANPDIPEQQQPVSLDEDHGDGDGGAYVDKIEDRSVGLDSRLELRELLAGIGKIPSERTRVLLIRTLLGDTQEEIGADYGISSTRVSQIVRGAVQKLEAAAPRRRRRESLPAGIRFRAWRRS